MRRCCCGRPKAWGLLVLLGIFVAAVLAFDIAVRPYASAVVACEAKNYAVQAVQSAVLKRLNQKGTANKGDYVIITRGSDGSVQSISSNVEKQNA
ncbi:MAG: hypothetical protein PHU79_03595, partial [Oscillospiraceae bacterium]|nr:hypothetical protein [Oscillospiraceae bacterium]